MKSNMRFKSNNYYTIIKLVFASSLFSLPVITLAQVQVTEASSVQNCHYLDKLEGSSGYGKNTNWQSLAKYSVINQAEKRGASHIVWENFNPVGGFNGIAIASAYVCKS